VFNFYSPFYAPPGEISEQALVAPELQIATEYLNTTTGNAFYNYIFAWNSTATNPAANAVLLDYSAELPLAGDSEALVKPDCRKAARRPDLRDAQGRGEGGRRAHRRDESGAEGLGSPVPRRHLARIRRATLRRPP